MSKHDVWDWVIWFLCMMVVIGVFGWMGLVLAEKQTVSVISSPNDVNAISLSGNPP
jgi:hypothetical protein